MAYSGAPEAACGAWVTAGVAAAARPAGCTQAGANTPPPFHLHACRHSGLAVGAMVSPVTAVGLRLKSLALSPLDASMTLPKLNWRGGAVSGPARG